MAPATLCPPAGHASTPGAPQPLIGIGVVQHARLRPVSHAFRYPTWFLLLPMRQLQALPERSVPGLARNRRGLVAFHDRDHGDGGDDALAWFDGLLRGAGITDADGEVWLHTFPRLFGIVFNPVSFWYAHGADGSLKAIAAEVNNTFGERHVYLLHGPQLRWGRELRADKVFHVSPFCRVQGVYRFRFLRTGADSPASAAGSATGERTVVRIDLDDEQGPLLRTSIAGRLQPLTRAALRRACAAMPLHGLAVIARIHWQALRLWLKRVPFHPHPRHV